MASDPAAPDFDVDRLAAWLDATYGTARLRLARISGGQSNPTYFVDHGSRALVLRKKPAGPLLPGAHAIEREFRVLNALGQTPVPVPKTLHLHEDPGLIGTPFYLMERLRGRVFDHAALAEARPEEREPLYLAMASTLAALHAVVPGEIGLGDYGRPGNYYQRQFARWSRQYRESPGGAIPALDALTAWLERNLPEDDGLVSISHGDYRIGNLMFAQHGPQVIGVLDWELSTLGHPLADLGFCCMPWVTAPEEYGGILGLDLAALGLPERRRFLDHYASLSPRMPPLRPFHIAFALFRFAVIFVGIADRSRAGNASSADAGRLGPLAERFAIRACDVAGAGDPPR